MEGSLGQTDIPILPSGYRETVEDGDVEVMIYYLGCLAQASYIVRDKKSKAAFIVDPRRDVDIYLQELASKRTRLNGIFLTHVHADFVSGHAELSRRGDADIYMGPGVKGRASFEVTEVEDGKEVELSARYMMKSIHTPGHTPESTTWLLLDRGFAEPRPLFAFTGDTLFIGSCGRPDLVGSLGYTAQDMAVMMYSSLRKKVMKLPDHVAVFPAHGAGSPCGKSLSDKLWSTIGDERTTNPALQIEDVAQFVAFLTCGQPHSPQYFIHSVGLNLKGASNVAADILSVPWVSAVSALESVQHEDGSVILDTRDATVFAAGHLPGALNIGKGGQGGSVVQANEGNFAIWVGTLIKQTSQIYIIATVGGELEALERVARIGYKAHAVVIGGPEEWQADGVTLQTHQRVYPRDTVALDRVQGDGMVLVDVRTAGEFENNHMRAAVSWPLADIHQHTPSADRCKTYCCYCVSGYRSAMAVSCLRKAGLNAIDVNGGFANLSVKFTDDTVTGKVCPTMCKTAEAMDKLFPETE